MGPIVLPLATKTLTRLLWLRTPHYQFSLFSFLYSLKAKLSNRGWLIIKWKLPQRTKNSRPVLPSLCPQRWLCPEEFPGLALCVRDENKIKEWKDFTWWLVLGCLNQPYEYCVFHSDWFSATQLMQMSPHMLNWTHCYWFPLNLKRNHFPHYPP